MSKAITDTFLAEVNKKFGKEVLFTADNKKFKLERIPTGILPVDILLGGGIPLGRWIEIYGDYLSLKTTIMLMIMAEAQKMGERSLIVDLERTITKDFIKFRGCDPDMVQIAQVDNGEEALEITKMSMQKGLHRIIGWDSLTAALPKREQEAKFDTQTVGSQGLLTSKMGRILTSVNKHNVALILINQTRERIGMSFGDPTVTSGGRAPKFYSSQRIRLIRIGSETESTDNKKKRRGFRRVVSSEIAVVLEKDKTGPYGAETVIHYDVLNSSINHSEDILAQGQLYGIVKRKGKMYSIGKTKMLKKDFIETLDDKPKLRRALQAQILERALEK